jgi:hypothetical protein
MRINYDYVNGRQVQEEDDNDDDWDDNISLFMVFKDPLSSLYYTAMNGKIISE